MSIQLFNGRWQDNLKTVYFWTVKTSDIPEKVIRASAALNKGLSV
jgi:hypothetical protein